MKEIKPIQKLNAAVRIPGSKSVTHRALIAGALARGESILKNYLRCEDTLYTMNALKKLGVPLLPVDREVLKIWGTGGEFKQQDNRKELYVGNSGTTLRFLMSFAALANCECILKGSRRMCQRPIGDLTTALRQMGVETVCLGDGGMPPVLVCGRGIKGGIVHILGGKSSQFTSSLLLCAPYALRDVEIEIHGKPVSAPYIDLTTEVMKHFGVPVERNGYTRYRVKSGQRYSGREFTIEGDVSSASYFWAAAAVIGGKVTTENIHPFMTRQGDIHFLDLLEQMGCKVMKENDRVTVYGNKLSGIEADMNQMPDMVPTLAAVALFTRGKTTIRNVGHLRYKESDRLKAIASEWKHLGAHVEELPDGLLIFGGKPLHSAIVDVHNDHRIAMSLAVVGLKVAGVRIKGETCVKKSYPGFWEIWDRLGDFGA